MAHAVYTRHLGRSRSWRKATVRSLTQALLKKERIQTTLAKAKEAQRLAERLITLGKAGTLSARRHAISLLDDSMLVRRLFSEVAPRFASRPGGYTRILHGGNRPGDGASMAVLELVELAPTLKKGKAPKAKEKEPRVVEELAPPEKTRPPKEAPAPPRQAAVPPKPEKPKKEKKEEKPKGFLDGLRKFFKKDRPKQ